MGQPYVGEIRMFGGNFAPVGWAMCDGRFLAISENEVLFQLIGTTYGGDGQSTFQLPDLIGRTPIHQGTGPTGATYNPGAAGGENSVTVSLQQLPLHTHPALASSAAATISRADTGVWAAWADSPYAADAPTTAVSAAAVASLGGDQPHENRPPYLAVSFIIATEGYFPSQS